MQLNFVNDDCLFGYDGQVEPNQTILLSAIETSDSIFLECPAVNAQIILVQKLVFVSSISKFITEAQCICKLDFVKAL